MIRAVSTSGVNAYPERNARGDIGNTVELAPTTTNFYPNIYTAQGKYILSVMKNGTGVAQLRAIRVLDGAVITSPTGITPHETPAPLVGELTTLTAQINAPVGIPALAANVNKLAYLFGGPGSVTDASGNITVCWWDIDANTYSAFSVATGFGAGIPVDLAVKHDGTAITLIVGPNIAVTNNGNSYIAMVQIGTGTVTRYTGAAIIGATDAPNTKRVQGQVRFTMDNTLLMPFITQANGWEFSYLCTYTLGSGTQAPRLQPSATTSSLSTVANARSIIYPTTSGKYYWLLQLYNVSTYSSKLWRQDGVNCVAGTTVPFLLLNTMSVSLDGTLIYGASGAGATTKLGVYDSTSLALLWDCGNTTSYQLIDGYTKYVSVTSATRVSYLVNDNGVWLAWDGASLIATTITNGATPTEAQVLAQATTCTGKVPAAVYTAMLSRNANAYVRLFVDNTTFVPTITCAAVQKDIFIPMNQDTIVDFVSVGRINSMSTTAAMTGNGVARIVMSFDSGVTWSKWNGSTWVTVSDTMNGGNTVAEFNAITTAAWATAFAAGKYRFGISMTKVDSTDNVVLNLISRTHDGANIYTDCALTDFTTTQTAAGYTQTYNIAGKFKMIIFK